jgi:hypothetical protein
MRVPRSGFLELQQFFATSQKDGTIELERSKIGLKATLRVVRYKIGKNEYALLTTLTEKNFSKSDLRGLYHKRWGIEEFFKTLKQTAKIEQFHSNSKNGILQEIYAFLLLQTIACMLKRPSAPARQAKVKTKKLSPTKGKAKLNHKLALSLVSGFSTMFLQNVEKCHLTSFRKMILLGRYYAYEGRHFPRVSHKPSQVWRCTKKTTRRQGPQRLSP